MTTEWTPTDAAPEPNKLVDADELSRAVNHLKAWFAAELERLTESKVAAHEDIPMSGTVAASDAKKQWQNPDDALVIPGTPVPDSDEIHQVGTSDV